MNRVQILVSPSTFSRSDEDLSRLGSKPILERTGPSGVLITSVHGFAHIRDGKCKPKDSGSLATSYSIALASESSWIAVGEDGSIDSNYHRSTPFKESLLLALETIKPLLVVDIHTSNAMRPYDVEIGSMNQLSWLGHLHWRDLLIGTLEGSGFLVSDNQVFRALGANSDAETITSFCHKHGVPAVQLELSSALTDELTTLQAIHAHAKLVNAVAAAISALPPRSSDNI
jgi:hypothetical protein